MESPQYIVVIGTSAGGANALSELVSQFTPEMDAAYFIVMHLSRTAISNYLLNRLQPLTSLSCRIAKDAQPIERGCIYISPPNEHLILIKNQVIVGHGPEENRWRPSIDVLFRTAAAAYSSRVIGITLTGLLNDGTSGMSAIKRSGGTCIVQDPNEAEYSDMPLNVLNSIEVDYCAGLSMMGNIIRDITKNKPTETAAPEDVIAEATAISSMSVSMDDVRKLGDHALFACPDCGGGLYQVKGDIINRYRCHVGHSYDEENLLEKQGESIESTLWVALRMMEERHMLFAKIAREHRSKGLGRIASTYEKSSSEISGHIERLKKVLVGMVNNKKADLKD